MKQIKIRKVKYNEDTGKLTYTAYTDKARKNLSLNLVAFACMMESPEFAKGFEATEKEVFKKLRIERVKKNDTKRND